MSRDWLTSALCAQSDPDLFTPDRYKGADVTEAKRICDRCPSRPDCLADALATERGQSGKTRQSIRGGLTPAERAALEQAA